VVVDGEARGLGLRRARQSLRAQSVEIAARARPVVAGDSPLAPAEVVGRRDVGEEVEALLVTQVRAGLEEPRRIDDERRLAVGVAALDQTWDPLERQLATPRIS